MQRPGPIDRRLEDTMPSTVSEALVVSVVRKHKSGPLPMLPASTLRRIERTLGEHPPRLIPPPSWRVLRMVAAAVAILASVDAVAVVGFRVVEAVKVHVA